jgi:hypothetical protein
MKTLLTLLIFFAAGLAHADASLGLGTHGNSVYLIPSTTQSCYARSDWQNPQAPDDIAAKYFQLQNFYISWNHPDQDLRVVALRVTIKDPHLPGGAWVALIAGNELASLDGSHGQWSMTLPHNWSNTTVVFNTVCAPTFGGVYIAPEQDVNFTASGEVTLIGFTVDSRGHQSPLQVSAPLNVTNVRIR